MKIQFAKEKKMEAAKNEWVGASYSHQKYDPPRCAMTATQAFKEYSTLKSATAQYEWVKDQILI